MSKTTSPQADAFGLSKEQQIEFLRKMKLLRYFETRVQDLFLKGKLPGFYHVYLGEEASAVGVCGALRIDDMILSTHRGNGHCLAKGLEMKSLLAEFFGKTTGCSHGRGGSMHIFSRAHGILGSNGIVGGGLSLAIGAAMHAKIQKTGQVGVCFFGDGASNEGIFQESINLAAVLKLPVIFVCENNLYATETPIGSATLSKNIADRAAAFGLTGVIADGNDVVDVYQKMSAAVERARAGEGPTLLENKTYRTCGHYVGHMETGYRSKEEMQAWKERDPIAMFAKRLTEAGVVTAEAMAAMDAAIVAEFEAGMQFADESPMPSVESLMDFAVA